jgi:hypothetical protein
MKLLVMQFPPVSRHFIPPQSKYSPQHPVLRHPQYIIRINFKMSEAWYGCLDRMTDLVTEAILGVSALNEALSSYRYRAA